MISAQCSSCSQANGRLLSNESEGLELVAMPCAQYTVTDSADAVRQEDTVRSSRPQFSNGQGTCARCSQHPPYWSAFLPPSQHPKCRAAMRSELDVANLELSIFISHSEVPCQNSCATAPCPSDKEQAGSLSILANARFRGLLERPPWGHLWWRKLAPCTRSTRGLACYHG